MTTVRATKTAKKNRFHISKTKKLACASRFFVHFLAMKLPHFTRPLYEVGTQNKNFLFLFLNFDRDLSDSTPENFANT